MRILRRDFDFVPFLAGLGMIVAGAALKRWRPAPLDFPAPKLGPRMPDFSDPADVAHQTREAVAAAVPDNLTEAFGRSLLIMGAGLILVRALDELEDRDAL